MALTLCLCEPLALAVGLDPLVFPVDSGPRLAPEVQSEYHLALASGFGKDDNCGELLYS